MADFQIPDKQQETNIDRAADSLLVYDNSATALRRATVNNLLDLASHPVGVDDTQTLTAKTLTAPTISSPVLSGTVTGTYTLGGTPTFPSAVVTLTSSQTLTNKVLTAPTINTATIANPTLTVDAISEYTSAAGVTIDGVLLKDNKMNGSYLTNASVNTTQIADDAVTPAKWTNPYCFRAYNSTTTSLTDATNVRILFQTENYDFNNNFASSTYTVPINGIYHFDAKVQINGAVSTGVLFTSYVYVNGANAVEGTLIIPGTFAGVQLSTDISLTAGDTVEIYAQQDSAGVETTKTGSEQTFFSGHLVHAT